MASRTLLQALSEAQSRWNIFTKISAESELAKPHTRTVAVKDNIATLNDSTSCSSLMLSDYSSPFDATVVSLLKSQDAVVVGKTNMDEFGMGSGTTHSHYGTTLNPLYQEEERICGGSSGGSAAAVASGVADIALGTDTGGSVRLPAAYTGVYGYKPSYGRLSRWGVVAYAQSLDTVGLLSRDLDLLEDTFKTLDTYDEKDPTSLSTDARATIEELIQDQPQLRVGIPEELVLEDISPDVLEAWSQVLETLASEEHQVVPVSIPTLKHALPVYYTLAPAEAASNLARYDGIRYGYRSDSDKNQYAKTRSEAFGKEVQSRIMLGNYNLNADSYKNHFLKAKQLRSLLCSEFDQVFRFKNVRSTTEAPEEGVDILITPTALTTAPTVTDFKSQSPAEAYLNDTLTVPASLAGLPAMSMPWYSSSTSKIPVGIQLMGQFGNDSQVLSATRLLSRINNAAMK